MPILNDPYPSDPPAHTLLVDSIIRKQRLPRQSLRRRFLLTLILF